MSPRQLWIEALRSGKYKQGTDALRADDFYCCLGVACELYQKQFGDLVIEKKIHYHNSEERDFYYYDGYVTFLPEKVMKWLGLFTDEGKNKNTNKPILTNLNDNWVSFQEIAKIIEEDDDYFVT